MKKNALAQTVSDYGAADTVTWSSGKRNFLKMVASSSSLNGCSGTCSQIAVSLDSQQDRPKLVSHSIA